MKWRRPPTLTVDAVTPIQEKNLRKSAVGRGRLLQHQVDLALSRGGAVRLDGERYILEKPAVLHSGLSLVGDGADRSVVVANPNPNQRRST